MLLSDLCRHLSSALKSLSPQVQFQKLQQLRLTQYHGGSLPNVSQLRSSAPDFQPAFHPADSVRGTRHHGLVERPSRTRFHPLHRRSGDKPGRQFDGSAFGATYASQPLDESWPRQQPPWKEEKHPGFRLTSALNRTNSDSALHTSALSTKAQDPYGGGGQSAWPASYMGFCDGENDVHGEGVSFPSPLKEENLLNVPKPLPKQLWETKEIQSLSGRPRSCDVGGGSAFPHNGQNIGLSPFLGTLNTGGSLPDLTNLHYSAPLPASLDTSDHLFGSMSVGNSVGNLPAAMTHLGIRSSSGLQSSRSNPSIQATLNKTALSSSLNSHPQASAPSASALHPSLRLFSLSNPSLSTTNLSGPSRRRQPPVSPLTLSPGPEAHQGFSRQLSSTSPLNPYPASQMVSSDRSPLSFLPTEAQAQVSPPPPYPTPQALPQPLLQQPRAQEPPAQQPQAASSLPQSDFQLLPAQVSPTGPQDGRRRLCCPGFQAKWSLLVPEGLIFDQLLPRCELRPAVHEARPSLHSAGAPGTTRCPRATGLLSFETKPVFQLREFPKHQPDRRLEHQPVQRPQQCSGRHARGQPERGHSISTGGRAPDRTPEPGRTQHVK
uniref:Transducer of regulated CREB activity middle domain-containing protein n=1 Tax=Sus scrofa TaxID=9823 RepID=A0A8D0Q8M2_PIG